MKKQYTSTDRKHPLNICYEIYPQSRLIAEVYEGKITIDNIIEFNEHQFADPEYDMNSNMLCDLRNTEITMLFHKIPMFLELFNSLPGENRKMAILVDSINCQLLSTIINTNRSKLTVDIRLFKSVEKALVWVESPECLMSINMLIKKAELKHRLVS